MTTTNLRKDLFRHLDLVAGGQEIEVSHKGVILRIVPTTKSSRLSRLIQRPEAGIIEPTDSGWDAAAMAKWDEEQARLFGK